MGASNPQESGRIVALSRNAALSTLADVSDFFFLSVRGRGKGRKRPSRWRGGGLLLKIEGGGGLFEEEGAGGQVLRGCPQGGGGGG